MIAALVASGAAPAVEILDATVDKEKGRYHVKGSSLVNASPEFIYATLMDFDNFYKISGGIAESRFVQSDKPGETLGYTRIEACVMFFCRSAEKLERIQGIPYREIRTEVIPEKSDFVVNITRWTLTRQDDATRLTYEAEFEPDFWMPPVISTWAVKRKLISSAENIGMRLEYLSQHNLTLAQIKGDSIEEQ